MENKKYREVIVEQTTEIKKYNMYKSKSEGNFMNLQGCNVSYGQYTRHLESGVGLKIRSILRNRSSNQLNQVQNLDHQFYTVNAYNYHQDIDISRSNRIKKHTVHINTVCNSSDFNSLDILKQQFYEKYSPKHYKASQKG